MEKIDFEKILIALLDSPFNKQFSDKVQSALKEQGLEYRPNFDPCHPKAGEIVKINSDKLKAGNVLRHGALLVLCLGGRKAVKCNGEQLTIQYSDEWVEASGGEYECFFKALLDNGYFYDSKENVVKKIISNETIDSVVQAYKDSLPFTGDYSSYSEALTHAFKQGIVAGIKLTNK